MQKRISAKDVFSYYWRKVRPHPGLATGFAALMPIQVLVEQILGPLVLARTIDRLSRHDYNPHSFMYGFGAEIGAYVFIQLTSMVSARALDYFGWKLEGLVTRDIAQEVYGHLIDQSADFHANSFGGALVSQTNKILGSYVRIADTTVYQTIPIISSIAFTIIVLGGRAPQYVAGLVIISVLSIVGSWKITKTTRHYSALHATQESNQTGYLADSVSNVMAIKSFAGGRRERSAFAKVTKETQGTLFQLMRAMQRQLTYFNIPRITLATVALISAVYSAAVGGATVATAFLIFTYTNNIISRLWDFCNSALKNYNRSIGDASEMLRILHTTPSVQDAPETEAPVIRDGLVEFRNVTFTHQGAKAPLFDGLSLKIKPGEKIGLVGHSGSGKTTLSRILLRFSDIDSGQILIDGQDISKITQDDLRANIAYVPQEPLLFHRSLQENIAYGKPDASLQTVIKTAKLAHADEFIKDLPNKYDTPVGERGVKLSGGQRQRVAIARAMIKDAPVLLLDEATSALDSESEKLIQSALWKLMEGRTAIVIAHRLSTIQKMDRIIVLDNGKIAEEGSHAELLKKKGKYAELWAHQSDGFIED